jgi:hypothetical protein
MQLRLLLKRTEDIVTGLRDLQVLMKIMKSVLVVLRLTSVRSAAVCTFLLVLLDLHVSVTTGVDTVLVAVYYKEFLFIAPDQMYYPFLSKVLIPSTCLQGAARIWICPVL